VKAARDATHQVQAATQANFLDRLITRWDSPKMRERRAVLARDLQSLRKAGGDIEIPIEKMTGQIEGVIDFFENMGLYVEKKLVDEDFIWEIFFDYMMVYWELCGSKYAISQRTPRDPTPYDKY
jgi:hypothetical protein